jgi:hypothetical protein
MKEKELFAHLAKQKKSVLLDYLHGAFREMSEEQRCDVFAEALPTLRRQSVDGNRLSKELDSFRRDSLARKYYAPFMMNSKNYRHIPEKTRQWCKRFAGFAEAAMNLTKKEKHAQAVRCFALLWELMRAVDSGEEIIFAEEAGSWMIPADGKVWLKTYLTSLAHTANPEEFATTALPILKWDSHNSFAAGVYASALQVANSQQRARLQAEIERCQIRIAPTAR